VRVLPADPPGADDGEPCPGAHDGATYTGSAAKTNVYMDAACESILSPMDRARSRPSDLYRHHD
jgi:hypothetical protein